MKVINTGKGNFIVKDKRGNLITLEPNQSAEVPNDKINKLKIYDFLKFVEDEPVKVEVKKEEVVVEKKVKKNKKVK